MVAKAKASMEKAKVRTKASTRAKEKDIGGTMEKEMVGSRTKAKAKVEAEEKVDTADADLAKARKEKEEKEKASKADVGIVVEATTRMIAGISQATVMRLSLRRI